MQTLKCFLIAIVMIAMPLFSAAQAQEGTTGVGEPWWDDLSTWNEFGLAFTPRADWCDELNVDENDYQQAFASGQTDAESRFEWCLQIKSAFYLYALESCQMCLVRAVDAAEQPSTMICECVCQNYSGAECQRCMEDPNDPTLLRLPNICQCIVRH